MPHFAVISKKTNKVVSVMVVPERVLGNPEEETKGIKFCDNLLRLENAINVDEFYFRQTSYHSNLKKNYAGIDYLFDNERNAFIAPAPDTKELPEGYELAFDEATCKWKYTEKPILQLSFVKRAPLQVQTIEGHSFPAPLKSRQKINYMETKQKINKETGLPMYQGSYWKFMRESKNILVVLFACILYLCGTIMELVTQPLKDFGASQIVLLFVALAFYYNYYCWREQQKGETS